MSLFWIVWKVLLAYQADKVIQYAFLQTLIKYLITWTENSKLLRNLQNDIFWGEKHVYFQNWTKLRIHLLKKFIGWWWIALFAWSQKYNLQLVSLPRSQLSVSNICYSVSFSSNYWTAATLITWNIGRWILILRPRKYR